MIKRTKELERDMKELKRLSALRKKDRAKYSRHYSNFVERVMKKYGVSQRSIQKWVKAPTPWVRDGRDDKGKERVVLPRKVEKMMHDAIDAGLKIKDARQVIKKLTGTSVSDRKRVRVLKKEKLADRPDTVFGSEAKDFFRKLFDLDLIPPDKGIKMKYRNETFIVSKPDLEDTCRILANAYNRQAQQKDKLRLSRSAYRKQKLWQLYDEAVTKIECGGVNIADLKEISLFIQRLEIDRNKINPRVNTMYKIIQHYNPDVTIDEVISLAEEYEGVFD